MAITAFGVVIASRTNVSISSTTGGAVRVAPLLLLSALTNIFGRSFQHLLPVFARDVLDVGQPGLGRAAAPPRVRPTTPVRAIIPPEWRRFARRGGRA